MRRNLVGRRTGPENLKFLSLIPRTSSEHTFSKAFTLRLVKVMRMRWWTGLSPVSLAVREAMIGAI